MQTEMDTKNRDRESDEELADVLTAISVVAKRLAKQLQVAHADPEEAESQSAIMKGVKSNEQDKTGSGRRE